MKGPEVRRVGPGVSGQDFGGGPQNPFLTGPGRCGKVAPDAPAGAGAPIAPAPGSRGRRRGPALVWTPEAVAGLRAEYLELGAVAAAKARGISTARLYAILKPGRSARPRRSHGRSL